MTSTSLGKRLEYVHERWRDQVMTALTVLLLLEMFLVMPLLAMRVIETHFVGVFVVLLITAGLLVVSRSAVPLVGNLAAIALVVLGLALRAGGGPVDLSLCLEAVAWFLIGFVIIWVVARAVFAAGRINYHRVIGAVLLYLSIGLVFVALYTLVGVLHPASFSGLTVTDRLSLPSDIIYFSFVTLTTVGYGDIAPVHPIARSLCNIESVLGQLYPPTVLARIVMLEVESRH